MNSYLLAFVTVVHAKVALVAALVLTLAYVYRRSSAQNRFLILKLTLVVAALLPLFMLIVPSYYVPIDGWTMQPEDMADLLARSSAGAGDSPATLVQSASVADILLLGYSVVGAFLLLRTALGYMRTRREIERFNRLDDPQTNLLLEQLGRHFGMRREIRLVIDSNGAGPYLWGIDRSVIAVPQSFKSAPTAVQRTVLTHELIHAVRRDTAVCLVSRILCCIYWINPVIWILNNRLKLEMERSCDDHTVNSGIAAADYADHLLDAIRHFDLIRPPSSTVAMARTSSLKHRIRFLLDNDRHRGVMNRSKALCASGALLLLGIAVGAFAAKPQAVPREDQTRIAQQLVPEKCEIGAVHYDGDVLIFNGRCDSATRVSAFMRNIERAGASPKLSSVKKTETGFEYSIQIENLKQIAPKP